MTLLLQVVVVLQDHVFIYNFMDLKLVLQIDTAPNPRGLCCLCASAKNPVVACPGTSKGEARDATHPPPSMFLTLRFRFALSC